MKKLNLLLVLFVISNVTFAQSYKILNMIDGVSENFETLTQNDGKDIFGYMDLTKLDLEDKLTETRKYNLLDKNMNSICSGEFKETLLKRKCSKENVQISYNNGYVIFSFIEKFNFDSRSMLVTQSYQILEVATNKIVAKGYFNKKLNLDDNIPKLNKDFHYYIVTPVSDCGFLIKTKKEMENGEMADYFYEINFQGEKIWEQDYLNPEAKHKYDYSLFERAQNNLVFLATKTRNDKKVSDHLLILDAKTGKKIATTELSSNSYSLRFLDVTVQDKQITIIGRFFDKQKRDLVESDESLGLYRRIVDIASGQIVSDVFLPYSKFNSLDINENGKIKKEGYLKFQKIDINPDGNYVILAETYVDKAKGAMFNELYAFILDKDFNPKEVKSFDTKRTRGYKYNFTQDLPSKVGKAYFFYDKNDDKELQLNILNYYFKTNTFSTSKINLNNDNSSLSIVPAKAGYVGIIERFIKFKKGEKSIELRLEKLNYERQ